MACSAVRTPLLRNTAVRHYAVAAAAQCATQQTPAIQVVSNKVSVLTADSEAPLAQVSVLFKTGSRNETYETQGLTHVLRNTAGLSTSRSSTFGMIRNIQQMGGILSCTSDRENISYTLRIARDKAEDALTFLEDMSVYQEFRPWELSDDLPRLRYEISLVPETTKVIELLHKAAYRNGLGYSLYCPKRNIGKISPESLQHFVSSWFTGPNCSVVSSGVDPNAILCMAQSLGVSTSNCKTAPTKYHGGEIRKDRNSQLTTVAVAVEGVGMNKQKDAIALAILQRAAGIGPSVKWGDHNGSLAKSVSASAEKLPFAITAFNSSYTDSGLFGFILSSSASTAGNLTKAGVKWLRSPAVSDADITRAKADLVMNVMATGDNAVSKFDSMVYQVAMGKIMSRADLCEEIRKVSASDVKNVASNISKSKMSLVTIGDNSSVPYLSEL